MRFPHPVLKHRALIGSPYGTLFPGRLRPGGAIEKGAALLLQNFNDYTTAGTASSLGIQI
ncbi:MAG: hypothetical protein WBM35_02680 [Candidatus Electrothrix sp.]